MVAAALQVTLPCGAGAVAARTYGRAAASFVLALQLVCHGEGSDGGGGGGGGGGGVGVGTKKNGSVLTVDTKQERGSGTKIGSGIGTKNTAGIHTRIYEYWKARRRVEPVRACVRACARAWHVHENEQWHTQKRWGNTRSRTAVVLLAVGVP